VRTCLACGHEGWDVSMTLVEFEDPVMVEVAIAVSEDRRGRVLGNEIRRVPGRYGAEWRCHDKAACADRLLALSPDEVDVASFFAGLTS
jgi:hypothetical protein